MKIMLLMTSHFGFHEMFIKNLQKLGYEVTYFDAKPFAYRNLGQKLINFSGKILSGKNHYKQQLKIRYMEEDLLSRLPTADNTFDYCLVIRPDIYTPKITQRLKHISKKLIAYQWDGFSRFNNSDELIASFDVFGIFDEGDYRKNKDKFPNLFLTRNFYFDFLPNDVPKSTDLFYTGTFDNKRLEIIKHFSALAKKLDLKTHFKLFVNNFKRKVDRTEDDIAINNQMQSYSEMISTSAVAKAVVDCKYPEHNGLSFRFFEALYFSQKIITNNRAVAQLDFYNENNVLIFSDFREIDTAVLSDFLLKKYIPAADSVLEKYSFSTWWDTIRIQS